MIVISLGGLLLSNDINYSGSTQGLDCSASCNVRGKRVKMRWWVTVGATVWCLCRLCVGVVLVVGGAVGLG